jgi:hypothetical protein
MRAAGGQIVSAIGFDAMRAVTITGIAYRADAADAARQYDVEVGTDPDGVFASKESLAINNVTNARKTNGTGTLSAGDSWGVRMIRTGGSGVSSFKDITVLVELTF